MIAVGHTVTEFHHSPSRLEEKQESKVETDVQKLWFRFFIGFGWTAAVADGTFDCPD